MIGYGRGNERGAVYLRSFGRESMLSIVKEELKADIMIILCAKLA